MSQDEENTVIATAAALNAKKLARAKIFFNQDRQKSTVEDAFHQRYKWVTVEKVENLLHY